jgi:hypothetical protein
MPRAKQIPATFRSFEGAASHAQEVAVARLPLTFP